MKIITQRPIYSSADGIVYSADSTTYGVEPKPTGPLPGLGGPGFAPSGGASTTTSTGSGGKFKNALQFAKDSGLLQQLGQAVKGKLSGGQKASSASPAPAYSAPATTAKPKKKSNTLLYVGIVGGVLLVGGLIYYAVRKNKK
jgi:hypothetical protein